MRAKRIPKLQQNTGSFSDLRVLSTPVHTQRFVLITRGRKGPQRYFNGNIMGDKLLLNFDAKFQRKLIIYTCKRTKLQWQRSVRFSAKMASRFQNVMNKDVRALRDDLENLNTRKRTSRRILSGILSKNSQTHELNPKCRLYSFQCMQFSIDTINMSKTHNCEHNLSAMILHVIGNQMVHS